MQHFAQVTPGIGMCGHGTGQPFDPITRLIQSRQPTVNWPMTGYHPTVVASFQQRLQRVQTGQPFVKVGVRCCWNPIHEHQPPHIGHTRCGIQHHQIVRRVPLQAVKCQRPLPDGERACRHVTCRRRGLGAFHPVAAQAVQVVSIRRPLCAHACTAPRQGQRGPIRPGLVAKKIIGVQVQAENLAHRLFCATRGCPHALDSLALLLTIQA